MPDLRERFLQPRAGWLSLLLLVVMVLSLAWAVQGAGWLEQLDFLVPVAIYAALLGAVLGLLPLSVAVTLPISAALGAAILAWTVGGEYFPELDQLGRLLALRADSLNWLVTVIRTGYPLELTPYALGLGILMWSTAFIASYTVYRHHRVMDAILLVGAALITNMSATFTDLFGHLVLFVAAALLLWLRASLVSRQESWQRRRVNENMEVPAAIMRSGIIFAAGSIALGWVLTSVAVAAPLTDAFRSLDTVWTDVQDRFDGVFGTLTNPDSRISGNTFGPRFTVDGAWISNDQPVMEVASTRSYYMRTTAYDVYTGRGWARSEGTKRQVAPGELIFPAESPERPLSDTAFEIETITVEIEQAIGRNLFAPGFPIRAFAPMVVYDTAGQPMLGGLEAANPISPGQGYQVAVATSRATEAELSGAGTDYPPEITAHYLDTTGVTNDTIALAAQVVADAAATDPYFQAKALADFLTGDLFTYQAQAPVPADGRDLVDFFLFDERGRVGYCEYYASAMVVMARALGIPARVAVGYAPGERTETGTFLIRERNAHAWAELYFPGYGWQIFEATKGIDPQFIRTSGGPTGTPIARSQELLDALIDGQLQDTGQISTFGSQTPRPFEGAIDATTGETPQDEARGGNATVIAVIIFAALAYLWFRLRRAQRRWRFLAPGERTWERLSMAAERAGVAPRPWETIYEYSGWLEDQIPARRPDIRTIADGKVWQAYSGRSMNATAIERIELAWQRLRVPLVLLTMRRWLKRLLRRSD